MTNIQPSQKKDYGNTFMGQNETHNTDELRDHGFVFLHNIAMPRDGDCL